MIEDMVRALCSGDGRLNAVERLISRLSAEEAETDPVPAEFRALWEAFRTAMTPETAIVG